MDCLPIPFKATQTPTTVPANTGTVTSGAQAGGAGWGSCEYYKIDPGASLKLEYRAKADGPLESAANYTNTATLTGTSMAGTIDGERTYKAEAQASVTAPTLGIEKSSSPDPVTIGQDYTSVIKVNLNAGVRYYSAGVVDTLPPGVVAPTAGQVSIACTYTGDDDPDANQCSTPTSSFLTEPPSKIGWAFGDVSQDDRPRTIAITYTSRVADVPVPPASTPDNKAG